MNFSPKNCLVKICLLKSIAPPIKDIMIVTIPPQVFSPFVGMQMVQDLFNMKLCTKSLLNKLFLWTILINHIYLINCINIKLI